MPSNNPLWLKAWPPRPTTIFFLWPFLGKTLRSNDHWFWFLFSTLKVHRLRIRIYGLLNYSNLYDLGHCLSSNAYTTFSIRICLKNSWDTELTIHSLKSYLQSKFCVPDRRIWCVRTRNTVVMTGGTDDSNGEYSFRYWWLIGKQDRVLHWDYSFSWVVPKSLSEVRTFDFRSKTCETKSNCFANKRKIASKSTLGSAEPRDRSQCDWGPVGDIKRGLKWD